MYSCSVNMIWILLVVSQLHVIFSYPTGPSKNVDITTPSFPDLEFITPVSAALSADLEKGNEKTHKIADSYRAVEPNVAGKSNVSSDQSRQSVIIIDHVSPDQQPPYGRPPMPPTVVEVFNPPTKPAGRPIPYPPARPYPPFRPGSHPHNPGLYPPNVPLPPDVEVFNPSAFLPANVPLPPDVEVFDPSNVRPILFPSNFVGLGVVPLQKNAIKSQVGVDDSSVKVLSTLDIPDESQGYPSRNAAKVYADFERLLRYLDSEDNPADLVSKSSNPEQKNISTTKPPANIYIASKENHDFIVKFFHEPPKMCYRRISGEDHEEKCINFSKNMTSVNNIKISDGAQNMNFSGNMEYQPENSTIMKKKNEYEMLKSAAIENQTSNEVNAPDTSQSIAEPWRETTDRTGQNSLVDDHVQVRDPIDQLLVEKPKAAETDKPEPTELPIQETTQTSNEVNAPNASQSIAELWRDTKDRAAEDPLVDDHVQVRQLINQLLTENPKAAETDKPEPTELPIHPIQETTTDEILSDTDRKNVSTEDPPETSENDTESPEMQQSSTVPTSSGELLILNRDQFPPSVWNRKFSAEEYKELCRLLAERYAYDAGILSTKIVNSDDVLSDFSDFSAYKLPSIQPMPDAGRSAADSEQLVYSLDPANLVLPESTSFDRSALPNGAEDEANSEWFLVPLESANMRSAESYLSPPQVLVPYAFEGYV